MKRDKKHNYIWIIAVALLCVALVALRMVTGLFASYAEDDQKSGKADVANFVFDLSDQSDEDLTKAVVLDQIVMPGDKQVIKLAVSNQKGDQIAEVNEKYSIEIELNGSMPLVATLENEAQTDTYIELYTKTDITDPKPVSAKEDTFELAAGSAKTDYYILTVEWPKEENDVKYANAASCGKVILKVSGMQED